MARIRVLFFTLHLGGGGAEKQLVHVANNLDPAAFDVHIAVCRRGGPYEPMVVATATMHGLAPKLLHRSSLASLVASGVPLRRLIDSLRPDIVCSFMDVANVVMALSVSAGPVRIGCVQNTLSKAYGEGERTVARIWPPLVRRTYQRLDSIIALSHGAAADLVAQVPRIADKVTVIHNAGVDDALLARAAEPIAERVVPRPLIVACGRLAPQKGYLDLLDAMADVRRSIDAHLWILGEGPQRAALERRIGELGLTSAVRLLGFQKNPHAYMSVADVYVLSSLYEGFGNVLVEAMATGRPVVSTDCPSGPSEIITDGKDGLLVPPSDPAALARGLRRLLEDATLATRLGNAARVRANDFHVTASAAKYTEVFRRFAVGRVGLHESR